MQAISVCQPWASLIIAGAKRIETRSWSTPHRGPLAIHVSKTFTPTAKLLCATEPFRSCLAAAGYEGWEQLPLGAVIGSVELVECVRVEEVGALTLWHTEQERAFGDYRPGRWAWLLANPKPLLVIVPYRGQRGRFTIPEEVIHA
jgi:hypothetical protein